MAKDWTEERKTRQAAAIQRWKPWKASTGPKTPAGKAAVSRNAWKHGHRSAAFLAQMRELRDLLKAL